MARKCVLCDAVATRHEHVIPDWLPRKLKARLLIGQTTNVGLRPIPKVPFGQYKAKITCEDCQRFAAQKIEHPAIPLLKRMMEGEPMALSETQQRLLATWAVKTTYMTWGRTMKDRGIPKRHLRFLREHAEPHPSEVFVTFGRSDGRIARWAFSRPKVGRQGEPHFFAYNFVAAFGQVALKVFGLTKPRPDIRWPGPIRTWEYFRAAESRWS